MFVLFYFHSLGESCSQVAAVMFKVKRAVRLGLTELACTSQACKWNDYFVTAVEPKTIADIHFYSCKAKNNLSQENAQKNNLPSAAAEDDKKYF